MSPQACQGLVSRATELGAELTIYRAGEIKQQLQALLQGGAAFEIDLSRVVEIDTAGVQLLMSAHREAQARGRALRFVRPSAAVDEALTLLALAPFFGETPEAGDGGGR